MKSPWLTLQGTILALVWGFMEVHMGFYPMLFPLFILCDLWVLHVGRQSIVLFLTVVAGICFWVEYSLSELWRVGSYLTFSEEHVVVSVSMVLLGAARYWKFIQQGGGCREK